MKLIFTGFIQVFFVAINTVFLSESLYLGVFVAAFLISMVWSWNVRRIVFGTFKDRIIYSLGAAIGSLSGLFVAKLF